MNIRIFVNKVKAGASVKTEWIILYNNYVLYNDTHTYNYVLNDKEYTSGIHVISGQFQGMELSYFSPDTIKSYKELQPTEILFDDSVKSFLSTVAFLDYEKVFLRKKNNNKKQFLSSSMKPDFLVEDDKSSYSPKKGKELMASFNTIKTEIRKILDLL